jgi:hypothetical protein
MSEFLDSIKQEWHDITAKLGNVKSEVKSEGLGTIRDTLASTPLASLVCEEPLTNARAAQAEGGPVPMETPACQPFIAKQLKNSVPDM